MNSLTLLLVAYSFPPDNESGAARPFRFYRYLPEYGVSPRVVTATPQESARRDVIFVRDPTRDLPGRTWTWHLERIARRLALPGEVGLGWSRHAAAHVYAHQSAVGPTAVLSTSPPLSTHLAAVQLKKRLAIPWIADFRDPLSQYSSRPSIPRGASAMIERTLLRLTDAVIVNTDTLYDLWSTRYPEVRRKLHLIWNGFDPSDTLGPLPIPQRKIKRLVHIGDLYGGRHPGPILDSMQRLASRGALQPGSMCLSLIGWSSDESIPNLDVLKGLVTQGFVEYVPFRIPKDRAQLLAREADALVLLQPHTDVQVPAKLFEYIRIGRPVLALITPHSPTERILSRSGIPYRSLYPDDPPARVDARILEFLSLSSECMTASAWFDEQFNGRAQTKALATIVSGLVRGADQPPGSPVGGNLRPR